MTIPFLNRISVRDRAFLARQLATMLSSGIPLADSLRVLESEVKNPALKSALQAVIADVETGLTFSSAVQKQPQLFNNIYAAMARSGEASGHLEQVLLQLADNIEGESAIVSKIRSAMVYPVFIIVAMVGVAALMMIRVIPQLKSIFTESGVELPFATRFLIGLSDFMVSYWWLMLVLLVGLAALGRYFMKTQTGIVLINELELRLPGGLSEALYMARFTRSMSMLIESGIPIIEAIGIVSEVMNNVVYKESLTAAKTQVERGIPLSVPLGENKYFPRIVAQMISVGEQTGKLDELLGKLALYYEEELDTKIRGLSALLEPFIIVILGIAVAFLVIAILMPIYNIAQVQ